MGHSVQGLALTHMHLATAPSSQRRGSARGLVCVGKFVLQNCVTFSTPFGGVCALRVDQVMDEGNEPVLSLSSKRSAIWAECTATRQSLMKTVGVCHVHVLWAVWYRGGSCGRPARYLLS